MISFTILVFIAMIKGLDIDCGCFGESSTKVGVQKVAENMIIVLGNLILIRFCKTPIKS
jgi:hypothetical protein